MAQNAFHAVLLSKGNFNSNEWYIDSGASQHMTPNGDLLIESKPISVKEIVTANNAKMKTSRVGKVMLRVNEDEIEVDDVLHVPGLSANLLSISRMVKNGNTVIFNKDGCTVYNSSNVQVVQLKESDGVYKMRSETVECLLSSELVTSAVTWHRRLGHINYQDLCKMRNGVVDGIEFPDVANGLKNCEVCLQGKQARLPFKKVGNRSKCILELVHSDLCGPMENASFGGAKYFLTFIDDFTRKYFVYFLKCKSEVLEKFKEFKQLVENQTDKKIKIIRSDNGTEYCGNDFQSFCKKSGIQHQTSNTYTPQQNGVAERANRTIVERAKCMLFDADLKKSFWAEAVHTAVYIINRSVNSVLINQTPEELWSGSKVNIGEMRIFGSPVMVHVPKQKRAKWDPKSKKLLFVGYDDNIKGFRCIDPTTKKITVSRDVVFLESKVVPIIAVDVTADVASSSDPVRDESVVDGDVVEVDEDSDDESNYESTSENDVSDINIVSAQPIERALSPRRLRQRKPICYTYSVLDNEQGSDPEHFRDVELRDDSSKWKAAMNDEYNSLIENRTWDLVKIPAGRKPIKSKWVFKTKRDDKGEIVRYKARLVAKGCSQKYGIDYNETYSPVVRYVSIRFLIELAVKLDLKIDQMDAVTAFLQGDLSEVIFMEQPEGFSDGTENVCKLNRSIYGLKQSSREWNKKLENALKSFGLRKSQVDPCVYFSNNIDLILAIYVDDILIFWKDEEKKNELKKSLSTVFKMKDMGVANNCVGLHITYNQNGNICLDQSTYIRDMLKKFNMADCKPVSTPSDANQKLTMDMCASSEGDREKLRNIPYQEAVGSLLYLVQGTRPDITFAVNDVSRFNANFGNSHWAAVKRIFRYLQGTVDYKLVYMKKGNGRLCGFTDADWASDVDKRRSCTGFIFKLCDGAISWGSKRQPTVALSSTEAEYMALSSAVQEAMWLKQFGQDFDAEIKQQSVELQCDNQSAIKLAESDGYRARSKHIDVRHHYIREKIKDSTISIGHVSTDFMVADNLTKAVPRSKHSFCTSEMGLLKITDGIQN